MLNKSKLLLLIIFIVSIWSINSFLLPRVYADIKNINIYKRELKFKKSFNDGSPANLSKLANEFILNKFDKNQLVNLIDSMANQSGIIISTLDVQADSAKKTLYSEELTKEALDNKLPLTDVDTNSNKSNTLKSVNLNMRIKGDKKSIDLFLSKLGNSKQYIDIQDISFSFSTTSNSITINQIVESTIIAKVYYINL